MPPVSPARWLASAQDQALAALWRGEGSDAFGSWLAAFWRPSARPEPAAAPLAISVLGGGGAGVRWHEESGVLLGYVPGRPGGCYRVPLAAIFAAQGARAA